MSVVEQRLAQRRLVLPRAAQPPTGFAFSFDWVRVVGLVNADSGYGQITNAINGFSDLVLELFGPEIGAHARTAVGYAALPLNNAVVIGTELQIAARG